MASQRILRLAFMLLICGLVLTLGSCKDVEPRTLDSPLPVASSLVFQSSLPAETPSATPQPMVTPPTFTGSVVYHDSSGGANNIFVLTLETGQTNQLTNNGANNIEPSWSPDGTRIAYACDKDGDYEIYVMNAGGTDPSPLTDNSFDDWGPDWSPDGRQLVFVSDSEPYAHLYILDIASGEVTRLHHAPGNESAPKWSPDGSWIIFMSDRNGVFNLYTVRPDGTDERQLTVSGQDDRPNWSPNGKLITFRRQTVSSSFFSHAEIFVAKPDGTGELQLTFDTVADDWPAISPDGQWVVYSVQDSGRNWLQVIPASGGAPASLIAGRVTGRAPDWKP